MAAVAIRALAAGDVPVVPRTWARALLPRRGPRFTCLEARETATIYTKNNDKNIRRGALVTIKRTKCTSSRDLSIVMSVEVMFVKERRTEERA